MPFVPAINVLQAELRYLYQNEQCENTLYFLMPGPPTVLQAQTLASELRSWWTSSIAPIVSSAVGLREIFLTDLTTQFSFTLSEGINPPDTGEQGGPPLPNNVTLCVSFRTLQRGRSFRGRNYVVGLTEEQVIGNQVLTGTSAAFASAYNQLNDIATISEGQWSVVSRFTGGAPRPTATVTEITEAIIVDNVVDSMRRRLPGRGS